VSGQKPREIALRVLQRGEGKDFVEDRLAAALGQQSFRPPTGICARSWFTAS